MDYRIETVLTHIQDNLQRTLSLNKLAKSVNLSPSRLRHLFKAETGVTPTQHLKRLRMQKAKEVLETTYLNVKEVLAMIGLTDESHFVRDFKKEYGRTPSQHRARINSDHSAVNDISG